MKPVKEEKIPHLLSMEKWLDRIDFSDTFSTTNHKHNIEEISRLVCTMAPGWVKSLMIARNKLVKPLGLKTQLPQDYKESFEVGGYVAFFKIFNITSDHVVLGADDSHLNFRLIVYNDQSRLYNIKVTTLVQFNNTMGGAYIQFVKPFHKLILRRMVKNAYHPPELMNSDPASVGS